MSMCRVFGPRMNAKAAATILLLVLVASHASSIHGADEAEGPGGGRRDLDEGSSEVSVAGLCIDSPCDADPNRTCFCCTRLTNEPCYDTLKQCVSICPNCNFLVCPPPAGRPTRRLGSPPFSA